LYINHISGERLTVSRLLRFANAPDTTGLRWLNFLADRGLVSREDHPTDARAVIIGLTEKARDAMNMYLSETLRTNT
jgi:DNA-binding MarR family transcriptional regulator